MYYDIDLIEQEGEYLVPLQTMNDFTLAPAGIGFNCFFNGQCVMLSSDGISADNTVYYAASPGKRSEELAEYGYNELCLMLDSLYGLKKIHEIGFKELLLDTDPEVADRTLFGSG